MLNRPYNQPERRTIAISFVVLTSMALAACSSSVTSKSPSSQQPRTPAASEGKPLTIGIVGPLTGGFAIVGISDLDGAKLQVTKLASTAPKIELLSQDDASDCSQSVNATIKLIGQGATAILGTGNSPCALAMVPVTEQHKVPQFTVGVGNDITEKGSKYIYRVAPSGKQQAATMAKYAVDHLHLKKIGIIHTNDEYGDSSANGMVTALKKMGLSPTINQTWTIGAKDFSAQIGALQSSGSDAVFITGSNTDEAVLVKQIRSQGLHLQILGDTGIATDSFLTATGSSANGILVPAPFDYQSTVPSIKDFVTKYQRTFHQPPNSWSAEMYDAVGMIHEAAIKTKSTDGQAIRNYISQHFTSPNSAYKGVMGDIWFDGAGNSNFSLAIAKAVNGKYVIQH